MDEIEEQLDEELECFDNTFSYEEEASESLLHRTTLLCTNLNVLVQNMITEAKSNWNVHKKIARGYSYEPNPSLIKRNRITIEVDAPPVVYFYSPLTIRDIVDMYWEEEFMQDIANTE